MIKNTHYDYINIVSESEELETDSIDATKRNLLANWVDDAIESFDHNLIDLY